MKRLLIILLVLILALFGVLVVVSETRPSRQLRPDTQLAVPEPLSGFEERLGKAVGIRTISHEDRALDDTIAFLTFHRFLAEHYPCVHEKMELVKINHYGLLYILQGNEPELKPAMLTAHQDVVPAPDSLSWQRPPFSGYNDGTYIWGRGTLDDKGSLLAILEATELLLQDGIKPKRTLVLAFGFDEEIDGEYGARAISSYLERKNIHPEFVLDEGLVLTHGVVPMMDKPVGLIGIAEKGYLTLKLSIEMDGGHSSMPDKESALTVLAEKVALLNDNPFDAYWCEPVKLFMEYLGPEMDFFPRLIFNNRWFFSPIIKKVYLGFAEGRASVRTTTAPTIFHSGVKDNVIPQKAEALVNFRILPGQTVESVMESIKRVIKDERVVVSVYGQPFAPPPPSLDAGTGFETIMKSITGQYPDAIAVPYLMLGSSDAKHYYNICSNIYRFAPYELSGEDMSMLHGTNEKISIESYRRSIGFYYRMIYHACY